MIKKIATTSEQDHKPLKSPQSSLNLLKEVAGASKRLALSHFRNNLVWLAVLVLGFGGLGWTLWLNRSFSQVGVVTFILAVAAVRASLLTGFPVWAVSKIS